jgi:glycine/D-amino acid oxidase-like deaminating enzyme
MSGPVVIVGAGLAGLSCAVQLQQLGIETEVLEASDGIGGRVRTDVIDGFLVDRGFQVILTAYPELHRQFDLQALDLRAFAPGALVWRNGRGSVVSDPFRDLPHVLSTALAPIGSVGDKWRVARMRSQLRSGHPMRLFEGTDSTTMTTLRDRGFTEAMIDRFFRPLVGGIQLDPELGGSKKMFDIIFRMLADGDAAVPAAGMGALPAQLADRLVPGTISLNTRVTSLGDHSVTVGDGEVRRASAIVVATEGPAASQLTGIEPVASRPVGSVWFAAAEAPTDAPLVILDGTGRGPVLNVAVMSTIAPSYAPNGGQVIAAALPGVIEGDLEQMARTQLRGWWGHQVDTWQHLATYRIAHGQPRHDVPLRPRRSVSLGEGVFVCGDHRDTASTQGALFSGRRCAAAVAAHLGAAIP